MSKYQQGQNISKQDVDLIVACLKTLTEEKPNKVRIPSAITGAKQP